MYSILFENNVTIIHLAKELTMKKYFKFVSSILTATILISILYPNMALAKQHLHKTIQQHLIMIIYYLVPRKTYSKILHMTI